MRGFMVLIAMLAMACTDPPGRDGTYVPPPPMPAPPERMDVIDEIDSAIKAAEAQEKIYDDPRFQKLLEDSLGARKDSLIERSLREGEKQER